MKRFLLFSQELVIIIKIKYIELKKENEALKAENDKLQKLLESYGS